jgi:hypothetical protein
MWSIGLTNARTCPAIARNTGAFPQWTIVFARPWPQIDLGPMHWEFDDRLTVDYYGQYSPSAIPAEVHFSNPAVTVAFRNVLQPMTGLGR